MCHKRGLCVATDEFSNQQHSGLLVCCQVPRCGVTKRFRHPSKNSTYSKSTSLQKYCLLYRVISKYLKHVKQNSTRMKQHFKRVTYLGNCIWSTIAEPILSDLYQAKHNLEHPINHLQELSKYSFFLNFLNMLGKIFFLVRVR